MLQLIITFWLISMGWPLSDVLDDCNVLADFNGLARVNGDPVCASLLKLGIGKCYPLRLLVSLTFV